MSDLLAARNDLLYIAVETSNIQQIRELAASGRDINAPCDNGASVLFVAVLNANVEVIHTLLELGADPNFQAIEPALTVYADTPLKVAIHARLVMNWEKYNPIVQMLIDYGARGYTHHTPPSRRIVDLLQFSMRAQERALTSYFNDFWCDRSKAI